MTTQATTMMVTWSTTAPATAEVESRMPRTIRTSAARVITTVSGPQAMSAIP